MVHSKLIWSELFVLTPALNKLCDEKDTTDWTTNWPILLAAGCLLAAVLLMPLNALAWSQDESARTETGRSRRFRARLESA